MPCRLPMECPPGRRSGRSNCHWRLSRWAEATMVGRTAPHCSRRRAPGQQRIANRAGPATEACELLRAQQYVLQRRAAIGPTMWTASVGKDRLETRSSDPHRRDRHAACDDRRRPDGCACAACRAALAAPARPIGNRRSVSRKASSPSATASRRHRAALALGRSRRDDRPGDRRAGLPGTAHRPPADERRCSKASNDCSVLLHATADGRGAVRAPRLRAHRRIAAAPGHRACRRRWSRCRRAGGCARPARAICQRCRRSTPPRAACRAMR